MVEIRVRPELVPPELLDRVVRFVAILEQVE
jgi:hypothetical protein